MVMLRCWQLPVLTIGLLAGCAEGSVPWRQDPGIAPANYAMTTPSLKEYPARRPQLTQPYELAFNAQRDLWFNALDNPYVGELTPKKFLKVRKMPKQKNVYGAEFASNMVTGPDGNVWFSDWDGKTVGTIKGSRVYQYNPCSPGCAFTGGLVTYGQNLWMIDEGAYSAALVEMTTKPKVTRLIPLKGNYCWPNNITVSPDGTFWIGNSANCPKITRVTQKGEVTDFPIAAAGGVWGITYAPDGNVWFAVPGGTAQKYYIGKITPLGNITLYPISSQPDFIAVGPDGNLWITLPYMGQILNMNLSGQIINVYTLPKSKKNSQPYMQDVQIIKGPDGNLWFGEGARKKIGELLFSGSN